MEEGITWKFWGYKWQNPTRNSLGNSREQLFKYFWIISRNSSLAIWPDLRNKWNKASLRIPSPAHIPSPLCTFTTHFFFFFYFLFSSFLFLSLSFSRQNSASQARGGKHGHSCPLSYQSYCYRTEREPDPMLQDPSPNPGPLSKEQNHCTRTVTLTDTLRMSRGKAIY